MAAASVSRGVAVRCPSTWRAGGGSPRSPPPRPASRGSRRRPESLPGGPATVDLHPLRRDRRSSNGADRLPACLAGGGSSGSVLFRSSLSLVFSVDDRTEDSRRDRL